jgi:pimeloyl-ACP methyl ester carboxylesterase
VKWLDGFLDALDLPSATLVGQSMGGAISLAYSMAYPTRVNRLILVDPLGVGDKPPAGALKAIGLKLPYLWIAAFSRSVDPYLLRFFQPWSFLDPWGSPREVIERMEALNRPHGIWPVWAGVRLLLADFLTRRQRAVFLARLGDIRVPTLIIWGRHDGLLPVEHAYQCAGRISNAIVEIFEHSAHEPMLEEPDAFNAAIGRFLSNTSLAGSN